MPVIDYPSKNGKDFVRYHNSMFQQEFAMTKFLPSDVVRDYSNVVSRYGPFSPQAEEVYAKYAGVVGFEAFAKAVSAIKLSVGGCGIDYEPPAQSS